jgi:hypothetical protein
MAPNQPFTIASVAPILDEFKKLSVENQGIAFLKRLAHHFRRGQSFKRSNLALPAHGTPDAYSLCTGWPREDWAEGVRYLLGTPWRTIEREQYIAESLSGEGHFEITPEGWAVVESGTSFVVSDRAAIAALHFLHPDLQSYEHYFRERKLKEAVTARSCVSRIDSMKSATHRRLRPPRACPASACLTSFSKLAISSFRTQYLLPAIPKAARRMPNS